MKDTLQWHPAFFAGLQIELEGESENLLFENEHQLGTKPKEIDVLVIKKDKNIPVKKNIGRIFRKHNIIEYKGPGDYISIDDFYKVYGYTCFYKADAQRADGIPVTELTLTFVSCGYPKKLFKHLRDMWGFKLENREKGIYYLKGNVFPIQFIITRELSKEENLWLYSLTDGIKDGKDVEKLISDYEEHKRNILYESVMDVIVRANYKKFKEVSGMCEALVEIMQPYITEQVEKRVKEQVEKRVKEQVEKQIKQQVEKSIKEQEKIAGQAAERGERKGLELTRVLIAAGRMEDLTKAMDDKEFRNRLYKELAIV